MKIQNRKSGVQKEVTPEQWQRMRETGQSLKYSVVKQTIKRNERDS